MLGTEAIPPYYDPLYGCEMELLRFDSTSPNPRYAEWIQACYEMLIESPVISRTSLETDVGSLLKLTDALSEPSNRATPLSRTLLLGVK
jgi:hypothetical protein